jgi:hypothetical protein
LSGPVPSSKRSGKRVQWYRFHFIKVYRASTGFNWCDRP